MSFNAQCQQLSPESSSTIVTLLPKISIAFGLFTLLPIISFDIGIISLFYFRSFTYQNISKYLNPRKE